MNTTSKQLYDVPSTLKGRSFTIDMQSILLGKYTVLLKNIKNPIGQTMSSFFTV